MESLKEWESFFVAQASAAAALTGLIFVAVSINLSKILEYPHLPGRAAESLTFFVQILFVSALALVPHLSVPDFGIGVLVVSAATGALALKGFLGQFFGVKPRRWAWIIPRILLSQIATLPLIGAGLLLLLGLPAGMPLLALGVACAYGSGIFTAWILLVEILR